MCKPWGWGESISGQKSDKKGWVVKVVGGEGELNSSPHPNQLTK